MKSIIILFVFLFLAACSSISSSQNLISLKAHSNETPSNQSPFVFPESSAALPILQENITEAAKEAVRITTSNVTLSNGITAKKISKGVEHIIEVIDVTTDEDGCLIKVDGTTDLINKGQTKIINGIRIYVADVRSMHSALEDKDLCQLVIA